MCDELFIRSYKSGIFFSASLSNHIHLHTIINTDVKFHEDAYNTHLHHIQTSMILEITPTRDPNYNSYPTRDMASSRPARRSSHHSDGLVHVTVGEYDQRRLAAQLE